MNPDITLQSEEPTTHESVTSAGEVKTFTAEDIAKARAQEKAKLYPQLEKLNEELSSLRKTQEEREAHEAELLRQQQELAKRKEEEELDLRDLLQKKEQEWERRFNDERFEREKAAALLEQERQFQELMTYRARRMNEEQEGIIPELLDLIDGTTVDEIEDSIRGLKDRSASIVNSAQQALTSSRRDMPGSRVTSPASGPLDYDPENRSFTPEDIKGMSLQEYAKNRGRLLGNPSGTNRGLFG